MFTINTQWALGKSGVRYQTESVSVSNNTVSEAEKAKKSLIVKHKDAFIQHLEAMIDTTKVSQFDIYASSKSTEMKDLNTVKAELSNIGTENQKELLAELKKFQATSNVVPLVPAQLAPASVVVANPTVATAQMAENTSAVLKNNNEASKIKGDAAENIAGLKVDMLITKLFQLDPGFFKGEITRVTKFQELITVVNHCLKSGVEPKTEKEWVKLGYSGQNIFEWGDVDELAVVNAFLKEAKNNPAKGDLVRYIASHAGNNEASYKSVLTSLNQQTLSTMAKKDVSDGLSIKDGKIEKSTSDSRIDALMGNDALWTGVANRDDVKAAIMGASGNGKTLDALYKSITGQSSAPVWSDDRAILSAGVNFRETITARLAIMRAIGSGNVGLDTILKNKTTEFAKAVQAHIAKHGEVKIEMLDKNVSSTLINSLSGTLGVLVAIGTAGIVTLRARGVEDIGADDILAKLLADPKLAGDDKNLLQWVADFFVGRRFKLAIGNVDSHDALKERVIGMARKIKEINNGTKPESITDIGLRTAVIEAQKIQLFDTPLGISKFQKFVLEQAIVNDGFSEKDNTRWSASLSIFFAGIHKDGVTVDSYGSKTSAGNMIEAEVNAKEVSLASLGITMKDGGKSYTIPKSIKDPDSVLKGDIPVFIQDTNGSLTPIAESLTKTFDKSQILNAKLIINNSMPVGIISFTENKSSATPALVVPVKLSMVDMKNDTLTSLAESTRSDMNSAFIDNLTIRTKFKDLQKSIANISNDTDVLAVFASLETKPQLKSIFETHKNKSAADKYTVLLSILGEFAGDQRHRKIRLYQQTPSLLDDKKEIAYLRPLLHTIIGGTARQVTKMADGQIKEKVLGLKMGDISSVTIAPENEVYQNTQMTELGLSGVAYIRQQYRSKDANNSVYTNETRTATGFGFMMNHQVLGKKTTFAGASALAPEMQIRDIDPIDVTDKMDKSKFISRLNTLQMSRITASVNRAVSGTYTLRQITEHLTDVSKIAGLDLQAKFHYAQFPNCTNDVLYMEISGKTQAGKPIEIDMKGLFGTSTVLDNATVRTNEFDLGGNLVAVGLAKAARDNAAKASQKSDASGGNTTGSQGGTGGNGGGGGSGAVGGNPGNGTIVVPE